MAERFGKVEFQRLRRVRLDVSYRLAVPSPASGSPSDFNGLKSFVRRHRIPVVTVLIVALVIAPILVYYAISYNSVNGTTIKLATGYRSPGSGYVTTFYLEVHVWSYATSIDTHVYNPTFYLAVDSLPFGTVTTTGGAWQSGGYLSYNLKFTTSDSSVASTVGQKTTNHLVVSMDGIVSAGIFSEELTRSDSVTWTFSA
jgi:hypothetical protein